MQNRWHRLYSARIPEWQCAGCGEPIGGHAALPLDDGTRVHLDDVRGLDCLINVWRSLAQRRNARLGRDGAQGTGR
jgi:hypothetical protein